MRNIIFALLFSFSSSWTLAQGTQGTTNAPLELAAGAPDRHIVVPGDTLWDISAKFLKSPYRWGELWKLNKDEVRNPQRIYPGQVLTLDKSGPMPRLVLETVRMRPQERVAPLKKEISSIPPHVIEPFLTEPLVLEPNGLDGAARIIAVQDERVIAGTGDRVYATNVAEQAKHWQVFRPGTPLVDPETRELLGHEAVYLGTAQLGSEGDPAEFLLRSTNQEVTRGDHLLPTPRPEVISYVPRAPEIAIQGRVLGVKGGVNFVGRYGVLSINRGRIDGVEPGHVLAVDLAGAVVTDRFKGEKRSFTLPNQKNGLIFIFRVFNHVSYALVMDSAKPISVGDVIHTP